jgi:hypothetical protein
MDWLERIRIILHDDQLTRAQVKDRLMDELRRLEECGSRLERRKDNDRLPSDPDPEDTTDGSP